MIRGGITHRHVAKDPDVSFRTIGCWVYRNRAGQPLENSTGCGRKSSVSRVAKIVISKSVVKRGQSKRTLAWRLTVVGLPVSKTTVHDYLRKSMHPKLFKPRHRSRLTRLQKSKRLDFARARQNWTIKDWMRVLFSSRTSLFLSCTIRITGRTIASGLARALTSQSLRP